MCKGAVEVPAYTTELLSKFALDHLITISAGAVKDLSCAK